MIKQVWQTSDGMIFDHDEVKRAEEHEAEIATKKRVEDKLCTKTIHGTLDVDDVMELLFDTPLVKDLLVKYFKTQGL